MYSFRLVFDCSSAHDSAFLVDVLAVQYALTYSHHPEISLNRWVTVLCWVLGMQKKKAMNRNMCWNLNWVLILKSWALVLAVAARGNALVRWSIRVGCTSWRALESERQRLGDVQKLTENNVLFAKDIKREFLMARTHTTGYWECGSSVTTVNMRGYRGLRAAFM